MPVNREGALKWYWKLCGLHGANPDGVQDEAAKAVKTWEKVDALIERFLGAVGG